MPWTAEEASRHKKGLSKSSKKKWAKIANSVLASGRDEGSAVRIANSRTGVSQDAIQRKLNRKRRY